MSVCPHLSQVAAVSKRLDGLSWFWHGALFEGLTASAVEKSSLDPDCRFLYVSVTFMQHIMCIASTSPGGAS